MPSSEMLRLHGTEKKTLKPSAIVSAAKNDLTVTRKYNSDKDGYFGRRHYAFHRKHVHKAKSAGHLIRLALDDLAIGQASSKFNTRLIYGQPDLLLEALELCIRRHDAGLQSGDDGGEPPPP